MKSRSEIWLCALEELGAQCSVNTRRDAETLASRVTREGDSFLKVALPRFAKDLEKSLAAGRIPWDAFEGFGRRKFTVTYRNPNDFGADVTMTHSGGAPKFLGGFMDLVFTSAATVNGYLDTEDGARGMVDVVTHVPLLRKDNVLATADAIAAIRQLCLMFGKEKELAAPIHVEAAYRTFIETDKELDAPLGIGGEITFSKADSSPMPEGCLGYCTEPYCES